LNPKVLEENYTKNKEKFHSYINNIKKNSPWDLYTIINPTLIKNPYASDFPKRFFSESKDKINLYTLFLKRVLKYYMKNIYQYFSYIIAFIIYKIYYKKQRKNNLSTIIDTFGLIDKTNQNGKFSEKYLTGIYEIFENYNAQFTILLRPYGIAKNPFKLKKFFEIINNDKRDFIFEYELLTFINFIELFYYMLVYPFKTLRLIQKVTNDTDKLFNYCLIDDIKFFSFDGLTRYILGKNISKIDDIQKIYSWSEFQVIERSFNYAIRNHNTNIKLIGLQFFLNYEIYFNVYVDDLDFDMLSSPHKVLVNGQYYVQNRDKVQYDTGVSLRYKDIFLFKEIKEEKNILVLGSYIENDTKYMLKSVKELENIIFKNHPAVDIKRFESLLEKITISNENIYKLFESAQLVIGTASGTSVEAVACGLSVIIIASQDNLTANPLVEYGKGKIWDIAFNENDVNKRYNELVEYRKNNKEEIKRIASWYKDNFFIPLDNFFIKKTFGFKNDYKKNF